MPASRASGTPTYTADRVRRLRIALIIMIVLGGLLALFGIAVAASHGHLAQGLVAIGIAAVLLGSAGVSLRLLRSAKRTAKLAVLSTGGFAILAGLVLAGSLFELLLPVLGLILIFLALIADHAESDRPSTTSPSSAVDQ